jgi:hypothetical protein
MNVSVNGRAPSREALQTPARRPAGGPPTRASRLAVAEVLAILAILAILAVLLYVDFSPDGGDEVVVVVPSQAAPSPAPTAPPTPTA